MDERNSQSSKIDMDLNQADSRNQMTELINKCTGNVPAIKGGAMRKFSIIILLFLFLFPCFTYAQNCEDWLGVWEVDYADARERIWIIDTVTERDSNMFPCMVSGIQITDGYSYTPFKIYWMDMGKYYFYTEEVGEMSQTMPMADLHLNGEEFTGDTGGAYDILSGKKTGDLCMTATPNAVNVDGVTGVTLTTEISFTEAAWPGDAIMDDATVEFAGDCADHITVNSVSLNGPAKTIAVEISVSGDAPGSVGAVVVKDAENNSVCRVGFQIISTQEPTQVVTENTWGKEGEGEGEFSGPSSVALDSEGNVYVVDTRNNRIQKFDADGYFITQWGSEGSGDGEFTYPSGIAVDPDGNVYVVDGRNYRIQKFDSDNNFLTSWGPDGAVGSGFIKEPAGVAVDERGNVYVADAWQSLIQLYDSDGIFITAWSDPTSGSEAYPFNPTDLAIDSSGNIFMTDYYNNNVHKFDTIGTLVTTWGAEGTGAGEFSYSSAIDIDGSGNVYVVDTLNFRIQQFDNDGNFVDEWGSEGNEVGELNWPFGIAVSASGKMYVADTFNHRVQIFNAGGGSEKCILTALFGNTDPRIDTIKRFRDTVLTNSESGRKLIDMYYQYSPGLNAMLKTKPVTQKMAKKLLGVVIPIMEMFIQ